MEAPQPREVGPYRLHALLGKGGMGEVYKAFDDRLERWIATKRLHGDATARDRSRFLREARTLAQLGHPGIVQIFDIVESEEGDWIVMELVDGPTLAELRHGGPLDVGLALDYARQIASALDAAHATGIIHRDLKAENVMVVPSAPGDPDAEGSLALVAPGRIKILDFGLARRVTRRFADPTDAGGLGPREAELSVLVARPARSACNLPLTYVQNGLETSHPVIVL